MTVQETSAVYTKIYSNTILIYFRYIIIITIKNICPKKRPSITFVFMYDIKPTTT